MGSGGLSPHPSSPGGGGPHRATSPRTGGDPSPRGPIPLSSGRGPPCPPSPGSRASLRVPKALGASKMGMGGRVLSWVQAWSFSRCAAGEDGQRGRGRETFPRSLPWSEARGPGERRKAGFANDRALGVPSLLGEGRGSGVPTGGWATHSGWRTRRPGPRAGRWWPRTVARPGREDGPRGQRIELPESVPPCASPGTAQTPDSPHSPSLLAPPWAPAAPEWEEKEKHLDPVAARPPRPPTEGFVRDSSQESPEDRGPTSPAARGSFPAPRAPPSLQAQVCPSPAPRAHVLSPAPHLVCVGPGRGQPGLSPLRALCQPHSTNVPLAGHPERSAGTSLHTCDPPLAVGWVGWVGRGLPWAPQPPGVLAPRCCLWPPPCPGSPAKAGVPVWLQLRCGGPSLRSHLLWTKSKAKTSYKGNP